jgi:hypothetical protein
MQTSNHFSGRRSVVLGLATGVVAFVGLSTILPEFALLVGRIVLVLQDSYTGESWTENIQTAGSVGWYAVEGMITLSAAVAAYAGSWLSPRQSKLFCLCVLALVVATAVFSQYPHPRSSVIWVVWRLAPTVGALFGIGLQWWHSRSEA